MDFRKPKDKARWDGKQKEQDRGATSLEPGGGTNAGVGASDEREEGNNGRRRNWREGGVAKEGADEEEMESLAANYVATDWVYTAPPKSRFCLKTSPTGMADKTPTISHSIKPFWSST